MPEMNDKIFYKVKFSVTSKTEGNDLLWNLVMHLRNWIVKKWNKKGSFLDDSLPAWTKVKLGGRIYSTDNKSSNINHVFIDSSYFLDEENTVEHWACKIIEKPTPRLGYCLRQWTTEIGFEKDAENTAKLSCVISYGDTPYVAQVEPEPAPSIPNFIKSLMHDPSIECHIGFDVLTNSPVCLPIGSAPSFLARLTCPERELPYIYISPQVMASDEDVQIQISNAHKLANSVAGNAIVFYADSEDYIQEMHYVFPPAYFCYSGAIRIYYPKFDPHNSADSYRHRYLSKAFIQEMGIDEILRIFRRAFSQNTNFYDTFFKLNDCINLRQAHERQLKLAEIESSHKEHITQLEGQKLDDAIEFEEKYLRECQRTSHLEEDLNQKKEELYNCQCKIDFLSRAYEHVKDLEQAMSFKKEISEYPSTPIEVVKFFSNTFADCIAFSDDAMKTLKQCTLDCNELWHVLFVLSTEYRDLLIEGNPDPYKKLKEDTGVDIARGEGSATRNDTKLMRQFKTTYDGREIDIEPHITYPKKKQSIHIGFDEQSQKIIIGSCGEHKNNYTTRKVH